MVVVPVLKNCVPTGFIPIEEELPVVAPVITQVSVETPQLSLNAGVGTATEAPHFPASTFWVIFAPHKMVGA
jgi:hypothetical protein